MHIAQLGISADQAQFIVRALPAHQCSFLRTAHELPDHTDIHLLIVAVSDTPDMANALLWATQHHIPVLVLASPADRTGLLDALSTGASSYLLTPLRKNDVAMAVTLLLKQHYPAYEDVQQHRFGDFVFEMPGYRVSYRNFFFVLPETENSIYSKRTLTGHYRP